MLLIVALGQGALAKSAKTGLYLTLDDYLNHKLSYVADGTTPNKIHLKNFFEGSNVVVFHDGKKQVFAKNEIFGYQLNDQDYRYYNNTAYKIMDRNGFFIYSSTKLVQQGKGPKPTQFYYFSSKANSDIKALTMDNLQEAFPNNTKFLFAVEGFFKSNDELTAYDSSINEYKLKYLYAQTTK